MPNTDQRVINDKIVRKALSNVEEAQGNAVRVIPQSPEEEEGIETVKNSLRIAKMALVNMLRSHI